MAPSHQRGFNLIEAMIAMVVLTIGLLGVAALQLTGMRNTQGSYYRSQATTIMNDLAERIYANLPGAPSYGAFDSNATNACIVPVIACAMTSSAAISACTPPQMAAYDLYVAGCSTNGAVGLLASGRLQATCLSSAGVATACVAGSRIRITVNWAERNSTLESNSSAAMGAANHVNTNKSISIVIQP